MQVHATSEFSPAIIVDSDSLQRLWAHVDVFAGPPSATVSCSDGVERKFAALDEMLKYENTTRAAAQTFELYGRTHDSERSVSVTVGRRYGAPATVSIRGEEQDVTSTKTRFMDTIAGMRAWYSPAATVDLYIVWSVIFITIVLVFQLMAPSQAPSRPGRSFSEAIRVLGSTLLVFMPVLLTVVATAKLRARYFPRVSVVLGQGARRHQVDEQVRWTVIVGFIVGLAGSVTYALLSGT